MDWRDFDLDDMSGPLLSDKEVCPVCGENQKQIRSKTCRACYMESRQSDPKWKGSSAWREAR